MTYRIEWRRPPRPRKGVPKYKQMYGDCDLQKRRIRIAPDTDPLELLFTMIHESWHACFPDLDDDSVDDWETCVQRLAKRMGLKVTFEPKKKR